MFHHCEPKEYSKDRLEELYKEKHLVYSLLDNSYWTIASIGSQMKSNINAANMHSPFYREVMGRISLLTEKLSLKTGHLDKLGLFDVELFYFHISMLKGKHNSV